MKRLVSTTDVAEFLGIKRQQVNYYIKEGFLKATKINRNYIIEYDDYKTFAENYIHKKSNNKNRGTKTLTKKSLKILKKVIKDIEDDDLDLSSFLKNNPDIYEAPYPDILIKYKRNLCIYKDKLEGFSIKELSEKYDLQKITIREIVQKINEEIMEENLEW